MCIYSTKNNENILSRTTCVYIAGERERNFYKSEHTGIYGIYACAHKITKSENLKCINLKNSVSRVLSIRFCWGKIPEMRTNLFYPMELDFPLHESSPRR